MCNILHKYKYFNRSDLKMKGSKLFYTKLLKAYNIKLLSSNFIYSSISWLINAKYRRYSTLNTFLKRQVTSPPNKIIDLAMSLIGKNNDKTVINVVRWVKNNVSYKSEKSEEWKGAYQTMLDRDGDCDDMNCLVFVLCYLAGVNPFQLFCAIGSMTNGGHYWCMYYSTKERKMVTLDTTYYASTTSVKNRTDFNKLKYHKNIWYLFNDDICVKPLV